MPLKFPDDVYLGTRQPVDRVRIDNAPMVFVGYGVTAPERGWDDFKGVELFYAIGERLANSREWPQWNATSEFAKVRAQSAGLRAQGRGKGERGR